MRYYGDGDTATMTVRQVHELLGRLLAEHGDKPLLTEGCDCIGDVKDAVAYSLDRGEPSVLLRRNDPGGTRYEKGLIPL